MILVRTNHPYLRVGHHRCALCHSSPIDCGHASPVSGVHYRFNCKGKIKIGEQTVDMMAPSAGSLPLLRWARGPLSVPCRSGTPAYRLKVKTWRRVRYHKLPHVPQLRTSPLYWRGLRCQHVSTSTGPRLPARVGSGAATCSTVSDPASPLRRAPTPPCVPWVLTPPPRWGGLHAARLACFHGTLA
jgi:hypothetical protein